jgi:hypothetical protein
VLEPDTFNDAVALAPEINKRTAAGKAEAEAFAAANAGKVVLSPDDWERCEQTIAAVRRHPSASQLLDGGERELSLFWNDGKYGVPCKSRFDAFNHNIIIDLKTCQDASPETFARTIAQYLYHVQAAFYFSGAEHVLNATPAAFAFIAVETEPPFAVACYALPANAILAGAHLANVALERYASALASGEWPGYPEEISIIKLPAWATKFNV